MRTGSNSARERMKPRPLKVEIHRCTAGTLGRYFRDVPLDQIHRTRIEQFIAHRMGEGAGAAGVNRDLARLRNLLNDAADRAELGLDLPRVPWVKLRQREEPESYRPMRDDEEQRLLPQLSDRIGRDLVEFLLHTGIRPHAAMQLRWEHVDLERWIITIPKGINKFTPTESMRTAGYRSWSRRSIPGVRSGSASPRPRSSATATGSPDGRFALLGSAPARRPGSRVSTSADCVQLPRRGSRRAERSSST